MLSKRLLTFVALLASLIGSASAQTLWQGTRIGMTPAEVAALIPQAVSAVADGGKLGTGAIELLRVNRFELVGRQFVARMFFKDLQLTQVMLSLDEEVSFATAMSVFNSLTDAMHARYGSGVSNRIGRPPSESADAVWLVGRTNISVSVRTYGQPLALLNVNYQVQLASEADKL